MKKKPIVKKSKRNYARRGDVIKKEKEIKEGHRKAFFGDYEDQVI